MAEIPKLPPESLIISASALSVTTDPDGSRSVIVHLHIPDNQLGLKPGLGLALRMTAAETRRFADALRKKADAAEAGLSRA